MKLTLPNAPAIPDNIIHAVKLETETKEFAADIIKGLSKKPKTLSSKYFYDSTGSRLFRKIMDLPEYYVTRTETEIFTKQQQEIIYSFTANKAPFILIDLGAGDAAKTQILLHELVRQKKEFIYTPIDISDHAMQELAAELHQKIPDLQFQTVASEYFKALNWFSKNLFHRKVVLFLGSNIGNFENKAIRLFAKKLRKYLIPGDLILMGFDLQKDPYIIRQAYDDAAGITAAFNYNLLHRINHEFEGNIQVDLFKHYAEYNPITGDAKSYLVSTSEQKIYLAALDKIFTLEAWEAIHTETSHKFTLPEIKALGQEAGFRIKEVFTDEKYYFADVLFEVV